jgi:two-component system, OmpR family, response regulator
MHTRILLIENDAAHQKIIAEALEQEGYIVYRASTATEALLLMSNNGIDGVVAELQLPDTDDEGWLVSAVQRKTPPPALFIQTAHATLNSAITAIHARATAYLIKPYAVESLLDHIAAELNERKKQHRQQRMMNSILAEVEQWHTHEEGSPAQGLYAESDLQIGQLEIDRFQHLVSFEGQPLSITSTQYKLLCCLAEKPGHTILGSDIVLRTHGLYLSNEEALVLLKTHVRNLRRKIPPTYLINVRGYGYRLVNPLEHPPLSLRCNRPTPLKSLEQAKGPIFTYEDRA